jgi:K+-sensing histidine kinase KdpD
MSKETDTPRTDAVQFQKKPISITIENEMLRALSRQLERELAASKAEVEELQQQKRNCIEIIDDDAIEKSELKSEIEADKTNMHDFIRKLLSFTYMEMPAHPQTQKFVHQYFNEIQS